MAETPLTDPGTATAEDLKCPAPSWFQRLSAVLFVIFCFELGLFLLIYPWTQSWSDNFFAWAVPDRLQIAWHQFWTNAYFRGAVSGLGILNVWIALTEVFRMFARNHANAARPGRTNGG